MFRYSRGIGWHDHHNVTIIAGVSYDGYLWQLKSSWQRKGVTLMKRFVVRNLVFFVLLALVFPPTTTGAQASNQASLAYVDSTGNVFVMALGAGQGTALTQDADFKAQSTTAPTHNYMHLRWSPDGNKLAFQDAVAGNLYVAVTGSPYQLVASGVALEYPPTWQPDSSAVVYVVNTHQLVGQSSVMMSIQQVAPTGGQATMVGSFVAYPGCAVNQITDQPLALYEQETDMGGNALTFAWTKSGWLYSLSCNGVGLALNNFSNQLLWKVDNLGRMAVSPDGSHAAGTVFTPDLKPSGLVSIDLASGRYGALSTGTDVDQVGWSADGTLLLYSAVDGQNVSLWKIPAQGGQPTQLFSDQGRYIGVITSTPDSQSAVFSYIPAGDNPQTQILSTPINGGPTNRSTASVIAQGGRPTYGVALPLAANPTAAPAACTPRTDWTFTYTVAPGDTLASIARRTGTTIDVLASGNCLANANVIYAGQVLRVPVAVQAEQLSARRIQFQPGAYSVSVQGQVAASGGDTWVLRALGGQTLSAQLTFSSGLAVLIVWGADGTVLISDHAGATSFSGALPSTQDYFIAVRGNPNSATNYTLTITVPPLSVPSTNVRRIQFPLGATTVSVRGQLAVNGIDRWVLRALGGQTLSAQLALSSGLAVLIVWGADGTVLLSDHAGATNFSGVLPSTQDYYIDVRGNPGSVTNYTLTITVPPLSGSSSGVRRIQFQPGATTVSVQGQVAASGSDTWVLRALAGQTLTAQLTFSSGLAILIVWGADGSVLISDHAETTTFSGVLPSTQDYFIEVCGNPNSTTNYTLTITVPPRM